MSNTCLTICSNTRNKENLKNIIPSKFVYTN